MSNQGSQASRAKDISEQFIPAARTFRVYRPHPPTIEAPKKGLTPRCQQMEFAMTFPRRKLCQLVGIAIMVATTSQIASADSGPHHPVRMLVPCPAGSPADISARKTAQWWSDNTQRQFFVENFVVGTASASPRTLAEALSDNHTILFDLADCDNDASIPQ